MMNKALTTIARVVADAGCAKARLEAGIPRVYKEVVAYQNHLCEPCRYKRMENGGCVDCYGHLESLDQAGRLHS